MSDRRIGDGFQLHYGAGESVRERVVNIACHAVTSQGQPGSWLVLDCHQAFDPFRGSVFNSFCSDVRAF